MGSESKFKLPLIDFSNIRRMIPGSDTWNSTRDQVMEALQEYGCFEAYFMGIPPEIRKSMFNSLEQIFDLPLEIKEKNVEERPLCGYFGSSPRAPLYESFGIIDALSSGKLDCFINLMWPQGNPEFRETMQTYLKNYSKLSEMVRRMVFESLGLETYLPEHLESTSDLIRFMKYKAPKINDSKIGLLAHKDADFLGILHQNVGGLEVQIKGFEEWIQIETTSPFSFVIMAGECLEAYTNGRIHAPIHQVSMGNHKERYSFACFVNPKADYIIETPKEMVDEEHPLLFKPFNNDDYLRYYMKRQTIEERRSARKAYCSV